MTERRNESLELISGFGSPRRTNTPTPTRAITTLLPALNLPELDELVSSRAAHDGDVGCLALLELVHQRKRRRIADLHLVAGGLLELRHQLTQ